MCEFCVKHGEGKKWYLNVKNYSNDLLSDVGRRKFTKDFFYWVDRSYRRYFNLVKALPLGMPIIGPVLRAIIKGIFIYEHWGQVIPIEDAEKILSITNSIVRVPCICRKTTTGKEVRVCFLISLHPKAAGVDDIVDQSFFGGPDVARFEKISKGEALNFMKGQEGKGRYHSIWTLKAPFIGTICNCDDTGCIPTKMQGIKAPMFFKSEYVVCFDEGECTGCGVCIKICPFGALKYDRTSKKTTVDYERCYGCGICRSVCGQNVLKLIDRRKNVATVGLWY